MGVNVLTLKIPAAGIHQSPLNPRFCTWDLCSTLEFVLHNPLCPAQLELFASELCSVFNFFLMNVSNAYKKDFSAFLGWKSTLVL